MNITDPPVIYFRLLKLINCDVSVGEVGTTVGIRRWRGFSVYDVNVEACMIYLGGLAILRRRRPFLCRSSMHLQGFCGQIIPRD